MGFFGSLWWVFLILLVVFVALAIHNNVQRMKRIMKGQFMDPLDKSFAYFAVYAGGVAISFICLIIAVAFKLVGG